MTETNPLILAERSVPRYTSYPTAPHFHAGIGPSQAHAWLASLAPDATLSLYLHVPYCAAMCSYCGCHTKVTRRQEPIIAYTQALLAEIALLAHSTAARRVTHLHWGGGTPTMLGLEGMQRVTAAIAQRFDLSGVLEHAIELDPRDTSRATARALRAMRVTRASLGVQDFNADVQRAIGRIQPFDVVAHAVGHLRGEGIAALNLDLIYGLPLQGSSGLERSLLLADSLKPDRIALFGYAHVPWMRRHQRLIDEAALPGAAERLDQARAARALLLSLGYAAVGLDHFTLPGDSLAIAARGGRLRRNFQGYSNDTADALLGLGASSISHLPQGFLQNNADIGAYRAAMAEGRLAIIRGLHMSADDHARGAVIERLMCHFAVTPPAAMLAGAMAELRPLADAGLLTIQAGRLAMTEAGRPFLRLAAAAFDAHLSRAGRHSAAV